MEQFSFDTAFKHWQKTSGPKGYIWKHLLAFVVIMSVIYAGIYVWMFSAFSDILNMGSGAQSGSLTQAEVSELDSDVFYSMLKAYAVFIPAIPVLGILYAMFETAGLRRYIRNEGFSFKLGADEWRTLAVYVLWVLTVIAVQFVLVLFGFVVTFVPAMTSGGEPPTIVFALLPLLMFASMFFLLFVLVRLSPASALTFRDRKITFFSARRVSKGRFWPMFGAYALLYLMGYLALIGVQMVSMFIIMPGFFAAMPAIEAGSSDAMSQIFTNPLTLAGFGLMMVGMMTVMGFLQFAYLGVSSRAALTDPNWTNPQTASVFD